MNYAYAVGTQFLSSYACFFTAEKKCTKKSNQEIADLLTKASRIFIFEEEQVAMDFIKSCKSIIPRDRDYGHAYCADFVTPVFEIRGEFHLGVRRCFINKNKEYQYYYESRYDNTIQIVQAKFPENRAGRQTIQLEDTREQDSDSWCSIL